MNQNQNPYQNSNTVDFKQRRKELQRSKDGSSSSSFKEKLILAIKVILVIAMIAASMRICTKGSL